MEEMLKQNQPPNVHFVGIKEKIQHAPLVVICFAGFAFYSGYKPKKNALCAEKMYSLLELYHCLITNKYHHIIGSIAHLMLKVVQMAKYNCIFELIYLFE